MCKRDRDGAGQRRVAEARPPTAQAHEYDRQKGDRPRFVENGQPQRRARRSGAPPLKEPQAGRQQQQGDGPVSYTHLTLPTSDLV